MNKIYYTHLGQLKSAGRGAGCEMDIKLGRAAAALLWVEVGAIGERVTRLGIVAPLGIGVKLELELA